MAKETALRVCVHGSTYCGICFHNLASPMALPGRPKYAPAMKVSKKPKMKKANKASRLQEEVKEVNSKQASGNGERVY